MEFPFSSKLATMQCVLSLFRLDNSKCQTRYRNEKPVELKPHVHSESFLSSIPDGLFKMISRYIVGRARTTRITQNCPTTANNARR